MFLLAASAAAVWTLGDSGWLAALIVSIVVVPVLVYLLSHDFTVTIVAMIVATVTEHYALEIGGLRARPEHISALLMCATIPWWWGKVKDQPLWIRADRFLLLYIAMNLFSSAFESVAPGQTLKWALQQSLAILPYFFLRILLPDVQRFRKALDIFVLIGVLESGYALLCFFSNQLFGSEFGMAVEQYGSIPGTYGTRAEANLLGSTSAACMLLLLTLYFRERKKKFLVGAAITFAATAISLSRAAVIAAGMAALILIVYLRRKDLLPTSLLKRAGTVFLVTTLLLSPALISVYMERFETVDITDVSADPDTAWRVVTATTALDNILAHPLLGNGTASFQLLSTYNQSGYAEREDGAWIGNTEVRVLHDMGLVGLSIFALFLGYLLVQAFKLASCNRSPELIGLLIGAVLYSITFQATEGTLLGFCWIHLGFIGCAVSLGHREEAEAAARRLTTGAQG